MRILVTGASGLLGRRLVPILLKAGHAVVATSRDPESLRFPPGVLPMAWDGEDMLQVPGKVDAVVHLAGEPIVGKRWTPEQKQVLRDSRIVAAKRIAEFVNRRRPAERPAVLVSANAVGYYGIRPEGECREDTPAGSDFLAQLCKDWEAAANEAPTRVVVLRIGHVLSKDGGYLGALLPLAKAGLAGPLGGGKQSMPWVHIDDVCGVVLWALSAGGVRGAYNVVAPQRLDQKAFVKALNQHMAIPSLLPVPAFAMKARFGEVAEAMLGGQDVVPQRLDLENYEFGHPMLEGALHDLLVPKPKRKGQARAQALAKASAQAHAFDEDDDVAADGALEDATRSEADGGVDDVDDPATAPRA